MPPTCAATDALGVSHWRTVVGVGARSGILRRCRCARAAGGAAPLILVTSLCRQRVGQPLPQPGEHLCTYSGPGINDRLPARGGPGSYCCRSSCREPRGRARARSSSFDGQHHDSDHPAPASGGAFASRRTSGGATPTSANVARPPRRSAAQAPQRGDSPSGGPSSTYRTSTCAQERPRAGRRSLQIHRNLMRLARRLRQVDVPAH